MAADILDDEMEAMMREIESMEAAPAPAPAPIVPEPRTAVEAEPIELPARKYADAAAVKEAKEEAKAKHRAEVEDAEIAAAVAAVEEKVTKAAVIPEDDPELDAMMAEIEKTNKVEKVEAPEPEVEAAPEPEPVPVKVEEPPAKPVVSRKAEPLELDYDQIKKDVSINPVDLDNAMLNHASLELHYALKAADARRAYERLKSATEILEATLDSEKRETMGSIEGKKPTEAAIRNAVVSDKRYAQAQARLIDAQHLWKMFEATAGSFSSRKDLLLEVARDRRKEREGDMRVLEAKTLRDEVAEKMRKTH